MSELDARERSRDWLRRWTVAHDPSRDVDRLLVRVHDPARDVDRLFMRLADRLALCGEGRDERARLTDLAFEPLLVTRTVLLRALLRLELLFF